MHGGAAHAARGLVLAERPVRRVQKTEALAHPRLQVLAVHLKRHIAPYVHFPQIDRRMTVADPFGDDLADAARGLQTDGIQAGGDEAVLELRRFAQVIAHVRREALRAAEELLNARALERRHPPHGIHEHRLEVREIALDLAEREILGDALRAPGPRIRLERAHEQLAGVVLEVAAMIVIAQHRHARIESRHILEEHVVVLARLQRHGDADACREIACPHAGAEHDILRIDGALLGVDSR